MTPLIRPSTEKDVSAIARIYAHYVETNTATYELESSSQEEMASAREEILALGLSYLVAEQNGEVVGYSNAGHCRPRPGYRFTIEDSVYIHPECAGQGIGLALLGALIEKCEQGPWRQMVAVIGDSANAATIRLHKRHGFRRVGTLHAVEFKFDRWVDSLLIQRALGARNAETAVR